VEKIEKDQGGKSLRKGVGQDTPEGKESDMAGKRGESKLREHKNSKTGRRTSGGSRHGGRSPPEGWGGFKY